MWKKDYIQILVDQSFQNDYGITLSNIEIKKIGYLKDRLWEQIDFPLYLKRKKLIGVNLCNTAPILKPDIIVIHDVGFKHYKKIPEVSEKKVKYYSREIQNLFYTHFAKKIITVSKFSKKDLVDFYSVDPSKITIIYNAWQHYKDIQEEDIVKFVDPSEFGKYYFAMSNLSRHKNFKWVLKEAKKNISTTFIIAGASNPRYFNEDIKIGELENVKYVGRVSDGEAKALMKNCKAFLSPSLFEGFGIPILEALSVHTQVIASDITVYHEVFDNAVNYINPRNSNYNLDKINPIPLSNIEKCLKKYSWKKSAKKLFEVLEDN